MPQSSKEFMEWLSDFMNQRQIALWGAADLQDFPTPPDSTGRSLPVAVSFAVPMTRKIMAGIRQGPTQAYAEEYATVNLRINEISNALADGIRKQGYQSLALAASLRSDPKGIRGDFPHKTAATRAGLGWIGRNCQLITRPFGPWVRLGTVFLDREIPCGPALEKNFCGICNRCVEACPAKALTGNIWTPGVPRESILDAAACDQWKKKHFFRFHNGHNCGICSAVCPYGLKRT